MRSEVGILLVEDSDTDAEMTVRALRNVKIAPPVTRVRDGAEALELVFGAGDGFALPRRPRLVLLDLKMPRVNGIEVLARLKRDTRTQAIPVVMLTSSSQQSDLLESYSLGANSYLVKPVDFARFVEEISHAILYWLAINKVPP